MNAASRLRAIKRRHAVVDRFGMSAGGYDRIDQDEYAEANDGGVDGGLDLREIQASTTSRAMQIRHPKGGS